MQLQSIIKEHGTVKFPDYNGERIYMQPFYQRFGLSRGYERWQPVVDAMLEGIEVDGPIYLMVDESPIKAGRTHRRKGLHVDGYWNPAIQAHGTDYGGSGHTGGGRHNGSRGPSGGHRAHPISTPSRHGGTSLPRHHAGGLWGEAVFEDPEAIILASSLSAAHGYTGEFHGPVQEGGDCSHIDVALLAHLPMMANQVYAGNVCCLHESLPVQQDSIRQLVRLNVPGWSPTL